MFEKTFTFWRQLIGTSPTPAAHAAAVHDDRRLWVRYPADLQGNVQVAQNQGSEKIQANIRDLSAGGANLLVDRPLPAGNMLTLELHAHQGNIHTVLACVVRSIPQEGGKWSLGCVFSRELGSEDLDNFGAQKVPASGADNRVWVRFACAVKASYRKLDEPMDAAQTVEVLNISASGIGLVVQPSLEAGALLTVDLLDKNGRKAVSILACVVHTTLRAGGDYAVGCNFIRELTEEELQSLL
jgi:c-di-GMP-binding flagellar brake protein YcgR